MPFGWGLSASGLWHQARQTDQRRLLKIGAPMTPSPPLSAPPGATGRVYGTVYSGLDLGFAVAAPVFGALLDQGMESSIFYGSAAALVLGVASAAWVGVGVASRPRAAPVAV